MSSAFSSRTEAGRARQPHQASQVRRVGLDRLLLNAGVIGPPLFCAVFLVEGAIHPNYDPWRDQVSLLSLDGQGWVQVANFFAFGVLMIAFAVGLRRTMISGRAQTYGPLLFGIFGVSLLLAGAFTADPPPAGGGPVLVMNSRGIAQSGAVSIHGLMHDAAALLGIGSLTAACFVMAHEFRDRTWAGWAAYSRISGVLTPVLFVGSNAAPYGSGGAVQRASIGIGWLWIALLAWHFSQGSSPPTRSQLADPARGAAAAARR